MKRPSFQFYPGDWLRDTALRSCSLGARGLWIDMICFMHEGTPYGHLKVNHKVILPANLARMVGETLETVESYLQELYDAGVFSYTEEKGIYSKRMVRDEEVRQSRASGGKLGGNPKLLGVEKTPKVNLPDNLVGFDEVGEKDKQKTTPSSSSSSSSSEKKKKKEYADPQMFKPEEVEQKLWDAWLRVRKSKRGTEMSEYVMQGIERESEIAGISVPDAIRKCVERNWISFEAKFVGVDKFAKTVHLSSTADPTVGAI